MKKLDWLDIEIPAKKLFDIWVDQPELEWAKVAWRALDEQGLTRYSNQLEKQQVLINLLSLAFVYHEFCKKAFDEDSGLEYQISDLCQTLEENGLYISVFYLGLIYQSDEHQFNHEFVSIECEKELLPELLIGAAYKNQLNITKALVLGFGSRTDLFISLWNSTKSDDEYKISCLDDLSYSDAGAAYIYIDYLPIASDKN